MLPRHFRSYHSHIFCNLCSDLQTRKSKRQCLHIQSSHLVTLQKVCPFIRYLISPHFSALSATENWQFEFHTLVLLLHRIWVRENCPGHHCHPNKNFNKGFTCWRHSWLMNTNFKKDKFHALALHAVGFKSGSPISQAQDNIFWDSITSILPVCNLESFCKVHSLLPGFFGS